tara:strand:- start:1271 stop:1972 length:702 start_codon:yes stop_codon:yes gene_type:complete
MKFAYPTLTGTIHDRYKRFLSDIELESGHMVNAHVPNTGSMKTCWAPDWKVLVTHNDNPKRKLKYTLEMTHNGDSWICVNTGMTNKLVHEALDNEVITELLGYPEIKPEKKVLDSRIDFFLSGHETSPDCYVEVKNVTLKGEDGLVLFPDSVSTRGQKHLKDLMQIKADGLRAVMLYVVNREDVDRFSPAADIDKKYAELLQEANKAGVEILVYQCSLSESEIVLKKKIDLIL